MHRLSRSQRKRSRKERKAAHREYLRELRSKGQTEDSLVYDARRHVLLSMGFSTYKEYLLSNLWASIRAKVLLDCPGCRVCLDKKAVVVHHRSYAKDVMEGNDLEPLISMCMGCHKKIEITSAGHKRTIRQAEHMSQRRVKSKKRVRWQQEEEDLSPCHVDVHVEEPMLFNDEDWPCLAQKLIELGLVK